MKKVKDFLVTIVIPSSIIIGSYAGYDYYTTVANIDKNITVTKIITPQLINQKIAKKKKKNYVRVLVLDLFGDGIKIKNIDSKNIYNWETGYLSFDFNNDGFTELVGIGGYDDAFLVYREDKKRDVNGGDIIGNQFAQNNLGKDADSFEILKAFTNNQDAITNDSPVYQKLELWRPSLFGHYSTHSKSISELSQNDIEKIELQRKKLQQIDRFGNIHGNYAKVLFKNGRKSIIQEIWLKTDPMNSSYKHIKVSDELKNFPDIQGMGTVISLREAMQKDKSGRLKEQVAKYINEQNYFMRKALLLDIIYLWSGVYEIDPNSRNSEDGINYIGDARKLEALEKFWGEKFVGTHSGYDETTAPHAFSAPHVLTAFNELADFIEKELITYVWKDYIDLITLKWHIEDQQWKTEINNDFYKRLKTYHDKQGEVNTKLLLEDLNHIIKEFGSGALFKGIGSVVTEEIKRHEGISSTVQLKEWGKMLIKGTSNTDTLSGTDSNNIFLGMDYDDSLFGGKGDDLYIYRLNDGFDTITESGGNDIIAFTGDIRIEDITYGIDKLDLIINIKSNNRHGIRIKNYAYDPSFKVEQLVFADESSVKIDDIYNELLASDWKLKAKTIFYRFVKKIEELL